MVSPSRSSTSRRRREDAGKLFIGVLILLGLVASVFLVFSNSLQFVRVGLVAALWAAAIGALAATKYRKEATIDKAKVRDLQTVYELQLEREVTARREYELGLEARVREEVGADAAELAALRAELTVLRQSLQRLFDGDLPMDRPALRAEATRVQELTSAGPESMNNSSANAGTWSAFGGQQPHSSVTPVFFPEHPEPPVFASPFDDPVTAETAVVSDEDEEPETGRGSARAEDEPAAPSRSGNRTTSAAPTGWADAFAESPAEAAASSSTPPAPPAVGEHAPHSAAPTPSSAGADRAPHSTTASTPAEAPASSPAEAGAPPVERPAPRPDLPRKTSQTPTVGTPSARRRRRAEGDDAPARRLSVAEIMANLQSEERDRR